MKCFIDSSVIIEQLKGNNPGFFQKILNDFESYCINSIVFSEIIYHSIGFSTGKSPLTIKENKLIPSVVREGDVLKLYKLFDILETNAKVIDQSIVLMNRYNLLPNDAIIIATCQVHKVKTIASTDKDFVIVCRKENLNLISS